MSFFTSYLFQTAVLSALVFAIGDAINAQFIHYMLFGFWVGFTPSIAENLVESSKRLMGVVIGGVIGMIVTLGWGQNSLSVAGGVFLSVLSCFLLGRPQSAGQAMITFCAISIGHYADGLNQFAWERLVYNTLGVLLGTGATLLLPPPRSSRRLQKGLVQLLQDAQHFYTLLLAELWEPTLALRLENQEVIITLGKQLSQGLSQTQTWLQGAQTEFSQGIGNYQDYEQLVTQTHGIVDLVLTIKSLQTVIFPLSAPQLLPLLETELQQLASATQAALEQLSLAIATPETSIPSMTTSLNTALDRLNTRLKWLSEYHGQKHSESPYPLHEVSYLSALLQDLQAIGHQLLALEPATPTQEFNDRSKP